MIVSDSFTHNNREIAMNGLRLNTRKKKSALNFITGIGAQIFTIAVSFICRTIFIATLGEAYLGINSLFANILNMLSLAELGVGTAITYYMYEPLEKNDEHRIIVLMNFYRSVYRIIAVVIALIGICIIPVLPYIVSDYERLDQLGLNAVVVFLIYLFQSVSSYLFFAHRSVIIKADQKEYIINLVNTVTIILQNVFQIVTLVLFKNFIIYVLIQIFFVVLQNLIAAVIAKRRYSYINNKIETKIDREEVKTIFKDCKAVFIYRINRVILKSTDNIILSAVLGLKAVALYSNYYVFYTMINGFFTRMNTAIIHSIGNLHTEKNTQHEYRIFKVLFLIMSIIGATVAVGVSLCGDELIIAWIGDAWTIQQPFSLLLGIELFFLCLQYFLSKYRNAVGLFQQLQMLPIIGSVVNIVMSVILVRTLGISGVILGTIIAEAIVFMIIDPYIIYKHGFNNNYSLRGFYFFLLRQILSATVAYFASSFLCSHIVICNGWISVAVHAFVCGCLTPLVMILFNIRGEETKYLFKIVKARFVKKA